MSDTPQDDVMIVDDTPANLSVLSSILNEAGYRNRPVISGQMALRAIERRPPAVILLDVRMPEMDGYTVCRALKAEAATRDIPVLFISAADDPEDRLAAFRAGGVDYLVKPFQAEEVVARVATHLTLGRQRREIESLRQQLLALQADGGPAPAQR